ncbi:hypothetical protein RHMOL_Rhmol13G0157700 [Rhododendron molle]|uniref:Uncharacterized protein n=1 Tax=Rhododendron molle TaxID=49168 RepID=A0ACC0L887_RHOML|nr:hypothetical protein RHMOL_Rhmol13G0157700 [Rhododendron molle]
MSSRLSPERYKPLSSKGTEAVADAAAALSAASIFLNGVDSNYSTNLLSHLKSLFEFADKYRGSYQASCPFYCSYSGYQEFYGGKSNLEKFKGDVDSFIGTLMFEQRNKLEAKCRKYLLKVPKARSAQMIDGRRPNRLHDDVCERLQLEINAMCKRLIRQGLIIKL